MLTFLNDNSFKNKSEKGRSLIEIIAILVIMAILLIAALIGFKTLLDYLKKKETSSQISTIGMRYKTDRLGKIRKSTGKVSLKEVYPEGTPCSVNDSTCIKTPDGGQVEVYSYEDTTSFVVVARNVQFLSCEEAILAGGYTKARFFGNDESPNQFLNAGTILTDADKIYSETQNEYFDASYFRQHPEKLKEKCQSSFALIYTNHRGNCENYYDGKCHDCPEDKPEKDSNGNCCEVGGIVCGVCHGCQGDTFCKDDKICVECENHDQCKAKYGEERPWCDSRDGKCKPCKKVGDPCTDAAGVSIGGMYCNENLECEKLCQGRDRWIPDPNNPKHCVCNNKTDLAIHEACDITTDKTCQDTCATALECRAGRCECKDDPNVEGSACSADCPCGKLPDNTQLECRNGHCINPNNETMCTTKAPTGLGLQPIEKRNKGEKCSYAPACPCNSAADGLLECKDSSCKCASLPQHENDACWGECGCTTGLECTKDGKAEKGKCKCPSENDLPNTVDAACHPDCGCGDGLKCDETTWKCKCEPPAYAKTLTAGKPCAGEDQCPQQCKDTECRKDGKSGHKTCCPEPTGCSDEAEFDNNGCLKYNVKACPPQSDEKKKVCDNANHICVECLKHTDCDTGYYCNKKKCVPCGDKARCLNKKNPIPDDVFQRCKYNCPKSEAPDKKLCSTEDNKTCVGCNTDADCEGDYYCDSKTKVCTKCKEVENCAKKGLTCCKMDGPKGPSNFPSKCQKSTAKDYTTSVTYYEMINGVCTAQTVSYCPLTAKAPTSTCTPCEGHYCGKTCCSRSTPCGLKANTCCEAYTFADGVVNLQNETKSFYVNSEDDMQFNVNIHGLTRFGKIKVCEGNDCTVYESKDLDVSIKTSSGQYGEITRTLPLKSGKTYKITLDYNNKCGSCSVTATCQQVCYINLQGRKQCNKSKNLDAV